jgi:PAS domain S-box-containing protein
MPDFVTFPRGRAAAVVLGGAAVQVAVQLAFGAWQGWDPTLALAAGMAIAVLAGALGGWVPGGLVAAVGAGLFLAYAADDVDVATLTIPAWIAAGVAAGYASYRWFGLRRGRERASAELTAAGAASHEALVTVDGDGTIRGWNGEAERLWGQTAEEVIGADASLLGPEAARLVERAREARRYAEASFSYARNGRAVPLRVRAVAYGDRDRETVVLAADDLSELERLQRDLEDLGARHEALRRALPLVAYVHPPGRRKSLSYVSPQLEALLGYTPDELTSGRMTLDAVVHPDDRARVDEELETAGVHEPFRSEYRLITRDGRVVPVRDMATTVRDASGEPAYVQGFLLDLSERVEFERERERIALARTELSSDALARQQRLDLVLDASSLLVSPFEAKAALRRVAERAVRDFADWFVVDLVDDDGALSRLTAAHADVLEHDQARAEAPGPDPEPDVQAVARRGRPIVVPDVGEADSVEGDGTARSRDSRIVVPMLARGHIVGVLTFLRRAAARPYGADDVAVAMEIARRAGLAIDAERLYNRVEEEADAARVLTYVADGVFLVDRTGAIRFWNPAAEAITGLTASTTVGRRPADVIRAWEDLRDQIPVATSGAPAVARTLSLETALGERWISISAVEFFGGTVYAFRDVTEAHRLDELKAEFVATASHELRTPLAAVYGAAQTLRRHDFALDEAGRERFVSMIVDEADRLGRIVNEILLANQLDANRIDLVHEPFDPRELLERVAEATRSHSPPEIALEVVARGPAVQVAADRDKVRQVLVNLIDNAMKYSPDGGTIELGLEPQNDRVRFYVRDEGLGIPPSEQERVFEKFYRVDPGMTRGVGGTGLGLYICSQLVERMGGRIWVESNRGEGSTFAFELPAVDAVDERTAGVPAGAREGA